jgi:hypothetical protein
MVTMATATTVAMSTITAASSTSASTPAAGVKGGVCCLDLAVGRSPNSRETVTRPYEYCCRCKAKERQQ